MPDPKIWSCCDDLVGDLKSFDWRKEVERTEQFARKDWEDVIKGAVASNTFRAFHRTPERPSRVFRDWASDAFKKRYFLQGLAAVTTRSGYDAWLEELVGDFQQCWRSLMGDEIPYGPAYKLPNLLLKCVALRPEIPYGQRQQLVGWMHVPLDSYTIGALRGWFDCPNGRPIPSGATMKFVRDAQIYQSLQHEIRRIAELAGVPPIAFDYLAWDAGHGKVSRQEP